MTFWDSNLGDSALRLTVMQDPSVPLLTNWLNTCKQTESLQAEIQRKQEIVLKGDLMSSSISRIMPNKISGQSIAETLPQLKKIKSEVEEDPSEKLTTSTLKSRQYQVLLSEMRRLDMTLSSMHGEQEGLSNEIKGLSTFLKSVTAELEQKLAQYSNLSESFEDSFWDLVQDMARQFSFEFSEFVNILGSFCSTSSDIPRLIDHGPESSWIFVEQSIRNAGQDSKVFTLSHQIDSCALSEIIPHDSSNHPEMCSTSLHLPKHLALEPTISQAHNRVGLSNFKPLTNPDIQSGHTPSFGLDKSNQDHICSPLPVHEHSLHQPKFEGFRIQEGGTALSTTCRNPLEDDDGIPCLDGFDQSVNTILPYLHQNEPPTTVRAACKRRMQRQRRQPMNQDRTILNVDTSSQPLAWFSAWPTKSLMSSSSQHHINKHSTADIGDKNKLLEMNLQFLLQKELKPSDVGNLGRIILPKRQAEENLPHLDAKEGLTLSFEDLQTSHIWNLRFRFWPNNKTRMYLLESTGNFVRFHQLQEGDFIVLYKNHSTGKYIISGKKASSSKHASTALRKTPPNYLCSSVQDECGIDFPPSSENTRRDFEAMGTINDRSTLFNAAREIQTDLLAGTTSTPGSIAITQGSFINDIEDQEDMIQELSKFENDNRSIDEIFGFAK